MDKAQSIKKIYTIILSFKNRAFIDYKKFKETLTGARNLTNSSLENLDSKIDRLRKELRVAIENKTLATNRHFIHWAPDIPQAKLQKGQLLTNREEIIKTLVKGSIGVEVGTQYGEFAKSILTIVQPREFHLIDISYELFDYDWFKDKNVKLHTGNSWELISSFEDDYFDWIYIDASHSYDNFRKDLSAASTKCKRGGLIICNDYTVWSPAEVEPYGILQYVHEFLQDADFTVAFLAFHGMGYHDIALKRD